MRASITLTLAATLFLADSTLAHKTARGNRLVESADDASLFERYVSSHLRAQSSHLVPAEPLDHRSHPHVVLERTDEPLPNHPHLSHLSSLLTDAHKFIDGGASPATTSPATSSERKRQSKLAYRAAFRHRSSVEQRAVMDRDRSRSGIVYARSIISGDDEEPASEDEEWSWMDSPSGTREHKTEEDESSPSPDEVEDMHGERWVEQRVFDEREVGYRSPVARMEVKMRRRASPLL